jgi:hypothetical protein
MSLDVHQGETRLQLVQKTGQRSSNAEADTSRPATFPFPFLHAFLMFDGFYKSELNQLAINLVPQVYAEYW